MQLRNIAECDLIERRRLLHFTGFLFVILKKPVKPFGTHEYDADLGFCFFVFFYYCAQACLIRHTVCSKNNFARKISSVIIIAAVKVFLSFL